MTATEASYEVRGTQNLEYLRIYQLSKLWLCNWLLRQSSNKSLSITQTSPWKVSQTYYIGPIDTIYYLALSNDTWC